MNINIYNTSDTLNNVISIENRNNSFFSIINILQ